MRDEYKLAYGEGEKRGKVVGRDHQAKEKICEDMKVELLKEMWVARHSFSGVFLEINVGIDTESKQKYSKTILGHMWLSNTYILAEINHFYQ